MWLCWLALTPLASCRWVAAYEGAPPDTSALDAPRLPDVGVVDAAADLAPRADVVVKDSVGADVYPFDARIFGDGGVPPDCSTGSSPSCPTEQIDVLYPTADTTLASQGNNNLGDIPVMNIGMNEAKGVSIGVLRFDLSQLVGFTGVDQLIEMRLELASAERASDCVSGCGSCASIERDGPFELRAMTNAWSATQVRWTNASSTVPWKAPGASDPTERGIVLSRTFYRRGQPLGFDFPCASALKTELKRWVSSTGLKLALQVISLGGQIVAAASEPNPCPGSHPRPALTVKWCHDGP